MSARLVAALIGLVFSSWPVQVLAQQRPLVTEDAETVGQGRLLLETGVDLTRNVLIPVSGLVGNVLSAPTLGISIGIGPVAELQLDGGVYRRLTITERRPAPLASAVRTTSDVTTALEPVVVGVKIRLVPEAADRPAIALRIATKLPTVATESGQGPDTIDFFASLLTAGTAGAFRLVGNAGVAILSDPVQGSRQDDLFTFGFSAARALNEQAELVGEVNGRLNFAAGDNTIGAEKRATFRAGARYTTGPVRFDAALLVGTADSEPDIGVTAGLTYVFIAFRTP